MRRYNGVNQHVAVADLDGDQTPEIIAASIRPVPMLRVMDRDGNPKPGWPVTLPYTVSLNATCPVVADLDGDEQLDVGVATEMGVSFFHADGSPLAGWPYIWAVPVNNPQWSAPAVADIDNDGHLEVAVGNAAYPAWGVHVIRHDGSVMPGWPKVIKPVFSSPALADLDGDDDLEVIAQEGDPGMQGYRLWVWHHDGSLMSGWPISIAPEPHSSRCSPAVADIDNDGNPEIITATCDGFLHVLFPDGTEYPGFPLATGAPDWSIISSPSVADIDNDGIQEIFLTYWLAHSQYVSGWHLDGSELTGFPKELYSATDLNAHSSTHVLDCDGDGDLDLATAGSSMNAGSIWVIEIDGSSSGPASRAEWPKIRCDMANRGVYESIPTAAVADHPLAVAARLALYPNPARATGELIMRLPERGTGTLVLYTVGGRRIGGLSLGSSTGSCGIPIAALSGGRRLSAGTYLIRWSTGQSAAPQTTRLLLFGP